MKTFIISIFFVFSCALLLRAQQASESNCAQNLRQARTVFDEGRLNELNKLLDGCINNGFTNEERTEAYRLLILSYIYLDEPELADKTMLALLKDNPEFQVNRQADPAEFINLYESFRTDPILVWGIQGGTNYTFVNVIKSYGVHDLNGTLSKYTSNFGFDAALVVEKHLKKLHPKMTLRGEFMYSQQKFTYENIFLQDINDNQNLANLIAIETQTWIGLNLLMQYKIKDYAREDEVGNWLPYAFLGPSGKFLFDDQLNLETKIEDGEIAEGVNEDIVEFREKIYLGVDAGAGVKRKLGKNYFNVQLRYSYGFFNQTKIHYDNGRLSSFYGFAFNDINTHNVSLSISLLFQYFRPKKILTD